MLTRNSRELKLPDHLEQRRETVMRALAVRAKELHDAQSIALLALTNYNQAVEAMNRALQHADGWCIEAACVIEIELIGQRTTGWETQTPEGLTAIKWRREFETASFPKVPQHPLPVLPPLTYADDLDALPRWPDDPNN